MTVGTPTKMEIDFNVQYLTALQLISMALFSVSRDLQNGPSIPISEPVVGCYKAHVVRTTTPRT